MSEVRDLYEKWNPEVNQSHVEDIQLILTLEGELQNLEQQNKELKGIINFIKNDLLDLKETGLSYWQELLVNRSIDMIG